MQGTSKSKNQSKVIQFINRRKKKKHVSTLIDREKGS